MRMTSLLRQNCGTMLGQTRRLPPVARQHTRRMTTTALRVPTGLCSPRAETYARKVSDFMQEHVYGAAEAAVWEHAMGPSRWQIPPIIEELKAKAKREGLWNLWMAPYLDPKAEHSPALSVEEYAPLAEIMGAVPWASELFNCSAPDTGNMEVLIKYGSAEQQARFLGPLIDGNMRSCFAMTEKRVASSDATNIQSSIVRQGDEYVVDGLKWWTSGAMDPRCGLCIFMGKTDASADRHVQQSMILVPMPTPGLRVVRPLTVYGYDDAPHGHAEVEFAGVRVPASNLLVGEGKGFEIAQGRLGPGRIHHCMRLIGVAERALALMCARAQERTAFGKPIAAQGTVRADIARARLMIDQCRLLCMAAARQIDAGGVKAARHNVALIKVAAPQMAAWVVDRAIQAHGAAGFCDDFPLAFLYAQSRALSMADGPDEVHLQAIAKTELARHAVPTPA